MYIQRELHRRINRYSYVSYNFSCKKYVHLMWLREARRVNSLASALFRFYFTAKRISIAEHYAEGFDFNWRLQDRILVNVKWMPLGNQYRQVSKQFWETRVETFTYPNCDNLRFLLTILIGDFWRLWEIRHSKQRNEFNYMSWINLVHKL